jgi:hypothetical protein
MHFGEKVFKKNYFSPIEIQDFKYNMIFYKSKKSYVSVSNVFYTPYLLCLILYNYCTCWIIICGYIYIYTHIYIYTYAIHYPR